MAPAPARSDDLRAMYDRWIAMWNGKIDLADQLVSPDRPIPQPPNDVRGAEGDRHMIEMSRTPFGDPRFAIDVEPIIEGPVWRRAGS